MSPWLVTTANLLLIEARPTRSDIGNQRTQCDVAGSFKKLPGRDLHPSQREFNSALSKARAAVEHAIAHLKNWRILSEEGGRYRAPLEKYESLLKAVTGLFFFATYE